MTTPPTSRYFAPLLASSIIRMYEVRSDGVSIAFPKDNSRWVPASLTVDEALKKPHLYAEVDINGTPLKEVNRNNINNELGANVFGRLRVAERALESRRWDDFREEITTLLSFIPVVPTHTYYRNPDPTQYARAWRVNNVTKVVEWRSRSSDWRLDDIERFSQLPSWYTPVQVATEADAIAPTPTYTYYKGTGPGWMNWYWRYDEGARKMSVAVIGDESGSWTTSGFTLDGLLNDEDVKPEQIPFIQFRG